LKLFNIKTDYREQNNLASEMSAKVVSMDSVRHNYVEEEKPSDLEARRKALLKELIRKATRKNPSLNVGSRCPSKSL